MNNHTPIYRIPMPDDIGESETLRSYSIRKNIECEELRRTCEEQRQRLAQMQDSARVIVMSTEDETIITACEQVLAA